MNDKAYCVNSKTCKRCIYYSRNGGYSSTAMCNYYLITGKHRNENEPVAKCNVRKIGKRLPVPSEWESDLCRPKQEALNA